MHILTKIFVVLVSLLAVAIVPLVVVQSANEATFREKWLAARTAGAATQASLDSERSLRAAVESDLQSQLADVAARLGRLQADIEERQGRIRSLETEKSALAESKSGLEARLTVFAEADRMRTELLDQLNGQLDRLRTDYLAKEKELADSMSRNAKLQSDFEVALEMSSQLREENEKLKSRPVETGVAATGGVVAHVPADRDLRARITRVVREGGDGSPGRWLVQIDHGSRDGIRPGWHMTVAHADGKNYVGDLVIERVDVDRSVGTVVWPGQGNAPEVLTDQVVIAERGR